MACGEYSLHSAGRIAKQLIEHWRHPHMGNQ
jgi:hypothetical protein